MDEETREAKQNILNRFNKAYDEIRAAKIDYENLVAANDGMIPSADFFDVSDSIESLEKKIEREFGMTIEGEKIKKER